ncbi:unnamed protein product, partial [marine sediment metagenome]
MRLLSWTSFRAPGVGAVGREEEKDAEGGGTER